MGGGTVASMATASAAMGVLELVSGPQLSGTREASGFLPPPYTLSISARQLGLPHRGAIELTRVFEP